ncbi:hypothetical protein G6011_02501 [Alternaria panax]|uniref:Heterokaryon incompatibility domain-containing protein n=1 Tax=Alternaria panax TaxID=48097 RepID=A0AAD4FAM4_9PLEO|nr:hypothetical protein G6011_02501 [Alternaria panax]
MPPKKRATNSNKKQRRSQAQREPIDRPWKITRRFTASNQRNSGLRSTPETLPPFRQEQSTVRSSTPLLACNIDVEPEAQVNVASNTSQSLVKRALHADHPTIERGVVLSTPPIALSKLSWASPSAVKINRLGFNAPTSGPSDSSKGAKWAEVIGQVSRVYSYKHISENQVRLLLLKPGAFDEQVNASLLVVNDDQLGNEHFPYSALSYNWGSSKDDSTIIIQDDPASSPVKSIKKAVDAFRAIMQDKMIKVKPNLYEALRHLRKEDQTVALWVDALCINQFDNEEKKEQVLKMAQIYHKAYNVNVWLGSNDPSDLVSNRAMAFIPKVIDPENHSALLASDAYIADWASLYELLKWSWFSRRWVIQELAFAQSASIHCGKHVRDWSDFQTAIAIFHRHFDVLKARLMMYYESSQVKRSYMNDDSTLEIKHLGANLLVDMRSNLFRKRPDGSLESTRGLEHLVCSLSGFDTSDPRDTINALRSISKEATRHNLPITASYKLPPAPNYSKDLFEIYRDFVQWVIETTGSIDIICRHWALEERKEPTPTTPRLVRLPSWILFVEDSAWGKGEDLFRGRKAGDSFVGLPDKSNYNACGMRGKQAEVEFPKSPVHRSSTIPAQVTHDMSIYVKGAMVGSVSFRTDPFPDGVITKDCLEGLGWSFDKDAKEITEVPDKLWKTLVADRDPQGKRPPYWYKTACQHCLTYQTNNGHINIGTILRRNLRVGSQDIVYDYLCRVRAVTWNRSFLRGDAICSATAETCASDHDELVGFGPPKTEKDDVIAVLYGCSVPVILRPTKNSSGEHLGYHFVGEAYIYGKMEDEAFGVHCEEKIFKLL